jgi:hypothetical protein
MMLRRYHPRPEDSPDDEDAPTTEDEQDNGPPATKPTARSAARNKPRG